MSKVYKIKNKNMSKNTGMGDIPNYIFEQVLPAEQELEMRITGGNSYPANMTPVEVKRIKKKIEDRTSPALRKNIKRKKERIPLNRKPFDRQAISTSIPANSTLTLVEIYLKQGIAGIVEGFGWYTTAVAEPNIRFSLTVDDRLVMPNGEYIDGSSPSTTANYNPSDGSIAYEDLMKCSLYVEEESRIKIVAVNTDAANAYNTWARVVGSHWTTI